VSSATFPPLPAKKQFESCGHQAGKSGVVDGVLSGEDGSVYGDREGSRYLPGLCLMLE